MLFKKNDSANLVSKSTKYCKNRPQKTKEAQNVVFNLKGRIPLLFYCVKHIHGQFKTYLKLRNIHFKQIATRDPRIVWSFKLKKTLQELYRVAATVTLRNKQLPKAFHLVIYCLSKAVCRDPISFTFIKHVVELKYFHGN
jgi:hypothetical protein